MPLYDRELVSKLEAQAENFKVPDARKHAIRESGEAIDGVSST